VRQHSEVLHISSRWVLLEIYLALAVKDFENTLRIDNKVIAITLVYNFFWDTVYVSSSVSWNLVTMVAMQILRLNRVAADFVVTACS